jgi:hypothetical protein
VQLVRGAALDTNWPTTGEPRLQLLKKRPV